MRNLAADGIGRSGNGPRKLAILGFGADVADRARRVFFRSPIGQRDFGEAKVRALGFPQANRVDTTPYFLYTCAVVLRALCPVVKGKSSSPGTKKKERGKEERPKWGASPAKP
jgi:hypothetical protein